MFNSIPSEMILLQPEQKSQLKNFGYVILDGIDIIQLEELKKIYYEKFYQKDNQGFQSTMYKTNQSEIRKEIYKLLEETFIDIVEDILPEHEIQLANFLFKPANSDQSEVGVHRDWSYVCHTKDNAFNLWIPLDDIHIENGGFYVIPESHLMPHGPRLTPFQDELNPYKNRLKAIGKHIQIKTGQALLYHPGIIHFSNANCSTKDRLVVGMVCKPINEQGHHYHLDENNICKRYKVDKDFYLHFDPHTSPDDQYENIIVDNFLIESNINDWILEKEKINGFTPESVANYYDSTTDDYLLTYGRTIQAFRPDNEKKLHQYIIKSAQLENHQKIIDAGCGVGGPAIQFAKKLKLEIEGISISSHQIALAKKFTKEQWWLKGKVNFMVGDYHQLSDYFAKESADRVLFLESLGHSNNTEQAIQEAFKVLKPGGAIYIKDFFPYEISDLVLRKQYETVVQNINKAYCYNVLDLNTTIAQLRSTGFEVGYVKKFDFLDDIQKRAAFEERLHIDLFGDLPEFRVAEWLELYFVKPCH